MKHLFWVTCWLPMAVVAQQANKGIRWVEGLTWGQVKAKAKLENKFILLDCYATWCAPCKKMDKEVYPVDSVGAYFNDKYIAVKIQMDATKNDNNQTKAWRQDATNIAKTFRVNEFPSLLFFSPVGEIIHREVGFITAGNLLTTARKIISPGWVYVDPFERYDRLIATYEKGIKQYDSMYYMLLVAKGTVGEEKRATQLESDLYEYLNSLPTQALFVPERLEFLKSVTYRSTDRWFKVFYDYSENVNRAMKNKNYAQQIVDKIILNEVAYPFLKANIKSMTDAMSMRGSGVKADLSEGDWNGLKEEIGKYYSKYYIKRSTLSAQVIWYKQHWNMPAFAKAYLRYLDQYGIDANEWTTKSTINDMCYNPIFLSINDKKILKKAVKWMRVVADGSEDFNHLDTYASLLYKIGQKQEALKWERLALQKSKQYEWATQMASFFQSVIRKMENGEKLNWQN